MRKQKNTKSIEDRAIWYIVNYLKKHEGIKNPKVIKRGVDIIAGKRWIEAKGSLKKETNIRVVPQALEYVAERGKLKDFFIYFVYNMASHPKLMIFDYLTFKKYKIPEIKYIIQPFRIQKETQKPKSINLYMKK